jgi:hypothetical protein
MNPGRMTGIIGHLSVAAGLLAATLSAAGCGDRWGEAQSAAVTQGDVAIDHELQVLPSRWLVPPQATLEPPLAAPVAIDVSDALGRLYLLELQPPELRVYEQASGVFVETMGREGDGPGEFRFPVDLAVGSSGTVAVLSMSGRVALWTPAATLAGEVRAGTGLATDLMAVRGDTFLVKSDLFPPHDYSEFRVVTSDSALPNARFRDDGIAGLEEMGSMSKNHSYAVTATQGGELLLSPPGPDYLIFRIGPNGQLRQTIRRPEVPTLLRSEEDMEAVLERVRKGFAAAGRDAPQNLRVPIYRPHVARLAVSHDGSLWALTRRGEKSSAVIDHFSSGGRFLASYRVQLSVGDLAVGERSIYLLARGDYDVAGIAVAGRPHATGERAEIQ